LQNNKYKLLIVDDDVLQLKKYTALFKQDFDCFNAISGEVALEIFEQEKPHAILCDVKMPGGMSGFDLCQKIKSASPQTIIILASSYNNSTSRIMGFESRADEYLNKMTSNQEIYLKVRNLVYTQQNIPASFPETSINPLVVNSFEDDVKAIIYGHYEIDLHVRIEVKIDLDTVAQKLNKSSRTLQRDFAREIGSTFRDFHNQLRMEIAAKLLINSQKSISEISELLCFSTPSVFSQKFKITYRMTPSKYRHNYLDAEDDE
jgi:YesN/AraC family two-component response regulator